ncbi:MAG TPA: calcium-binding protein, partial [Candidatus Limnocylindria bacterium]|nr:calcium-binding protein [Candidatus Limnocylindria bacterium]
MTGGDANAMSSAPDVSANGRIVTFASDASNLVDGDTNGIVDVFAWDRANGTTQRVSVNSAGQQQDGWCHPFPVVSGSGRFVAFLSGARNLAPGATNFACHTYVRDLVAGTTEIVSVSSSGGIANGNGADWPAITPDGRYVAFTSYASNLVPNDTNSQPDVFLRDRATGTTTLVSATPAGIVGTRESGLPDVSDDGRFVVFTSASTDLVPGDANGNGGDVYLRDTIAGTTERVSVSSSGVQGAGTGCCTSVSISPDGRYVLFATSAG